MVMSKTIQMIECERGLGGGGACKQGCGVVEEQAVHEREISLSLSLSPPLPPPSPSGAVGFFALLVSFDENVAHKYISSSVVIIVY